MSASRPTENADLRARLTAAEARCQRYREVFLDLLAQPFDDFDTAVQRLLHVLSEALDIAYVSYWVYSEQGDSLHCLHLCSQGLPRAHPAPLFRSELPRYFSAAASEFVVAAEDVHRDPRLTELVDEYFLPLGIRALMDVPVRGFGRRLGIVCHEHVGGPRSFAAEEQTFASAVATQIALAYEKEAARQSETALLERTLVDAATGLPNRVRFLDALAEAHRSGEPTGLLVLRVDQYGTLVDHAGLRRAEALMQAVAGRIEPLLAPDMIAGRLCNHMLGLLVPGAPGRCEELGQKLLALSAEPFATHEGRLFATFTVAYSHLEGAALGDPEGQLLQARQAMLGATRTEPKRPLPYRPSLARAAERRHLLEQDLRRGLEAREFDLHYQPVLAADGRLVEVEALLRWQHPERGLVAPADFLDVAVHCGVMLELGRRVLHHACAGLLKLRVALGLCDLSLAINLSAPELLLPDTPEWIPAELARHGLPGDALTIEVTEDAVLHDLDQTSAALERLKASGVHVALDDFGTAYSSLTWLRRLPFDEVKIDKSFVAGLPEQREDLAIVRAITELSRQFGKRVVAEGIERPEQLAAVQEIGVDRLQGFLFSAPRSLAAFDRELPRRLTARLRGD